MKNTTVPINQYKEGKKHNIYTGWFVISRQQDITGLLKEGTFEKLSLNNLPEGTGVFLYRILAIYNGQEKTFD